MTLDCATVPMLEAKDWILFFQYDTRFQCRAHASLYYQLQNHGLKSVFSFFRVCWIGTVYLMYWQLNQSVWLFINAGSLMQRNQGTYTETVLRREDSSLTGLAFSTNFFFRILELRVAKFCRFLTLRFYLVLAAYLSNRMKRKYRRLHLSNIACCELPQSSDMGTSWWCVLIDICLRQFWFVTRSFFHYKNPLLGHYSWRIVWILIPCRKTPI